MGDRENSMASSSVHIPRIKLEPVDCSDTLVDSDVLQSQAVLNSAQRIRKPDPIHPNVMPHSSAGDATQKSIKPHNVSKCNQGVSQPPACQNLYTAYESVHDIAYTPEKALQQGLSMVKIIKGHIQSLELGSRMRKELWLREVAGLETQGAPTTLIAVCGATGAGKSSLLNAILDNNIVPTSGMRACTAVVTEIAYHTKPTINADISFLSLDEWKAELEILLDDLVDEDGIVRRANDLRSDAGIAWHKVHAVYPSIGQDQLARMTADQIIQYDPTITKLLGTTKHICSKDSKAFSIDISKYIDSKDRKRKKSKDGKDKKKGDKNTAPTDDVINEPALWPLIRQVAVKCKSATLSTGAILVDLPGVADANAARSNICKDYMKKCACIWILAPITRAVDDRTAKDLLGDAFKIQLKMDGIYDGSAITFIATKADDISCSEVIRSLKLEDDEEIVAIEERIDAIKQDQKTWKSRKAEAVQATKAAEKELKNARAIGVDYREHLNALQIGESFQPKLTANVQRGKRKANLGKRKRAAARSKKVAKRQKSDPDKEGSDVIDTEDEEIDLDDFDELDGFEDASENDDSDSDSDSKSSEFESDEDSNSEPDLDSEQQTDDALEAQEVITEEYLKAKIGETNDAIKMLRTRLSNERTKQRKAADEIVNATGKLAKAQTKKNGVCSLKRSEFSRDILKEDFRAGLREFDEAEAQEQNPLNFDPTQQVRNYEDIDLPTFCASARDYIRITKQAKGDGKPTCFTDVADTGIPDLQKWCQTLTVSSRQRAARTFLAHLRAFIISAINYVGGITEVREEDRSALRELWQSQTGEDGENNEDEDEDVDPFFWLRLDAWTHGENGAFLAKKKGETAKSNLSGTRVGIMHRLIKDFEEVVDNAVAELKSKFENSLNEKLQTGAAKAAASAVEISDGFAASMHWASYRATLRRDGSFRRCLNTDLINPLTKNIASSWARVFEADLFGSVESQAMGIIGKLLEDIEKSAAPGLKDRSKQQGEVALEEVKIAMKSMVTAVQLILNENQKGVSRCLVPHIQAQLRLGYHQAYEERGCGSVARQKAVFHDYIETVRNSIFNGGAGTLLERLNEAADSVGGTLMTAFEIMSQKVEVSMSLLWERSYCDDPHQARARRKTLETLKKINTQVALWSTAARAN